MKHISLGVRGSFSLLVQRPRTRQNERVHNRRWRTPPPPRSAVPRLWQWIRHRVRLEDGRTVDAALCSAMLDEELAKLREAARDGGRYDDAADLSRQLVEAPSFAEFLTLPAYDLITADAA